MVKDASRLTPTSFHNMKKPRPGPGGSSRGYSAVSVSEEPADGISKNEKVFALGRSIVRNSRRISKRGRRT